MVRKNQVELTCQHCKKKFSVQYYRRDTAKFCSKKCQDSFPMSAEQKEKLRKASLNKPIYEHKKDCKCFRCTRIPWNKNKKGMQKHSLMTRKVMSKKRKEYLSKNQIWNKGKKHSEETMKKFLTRKMAMTNTKIEMKIQNVLTELEIPFRTNEPMYGRPDIFIEPNVAIFADGCYWHNCKKCFPNKKFPVEDRMIKDKHVTELLISKGYMVLRYWEHDINNNFDLVLKGILNAVKSSKDGMYINKEF